MFEILDEPMPIPARAPAYGGGRQPIYPFADLKVGGPPFRAPADMGKTKNSSDRRMNSISSSSWTWAKGHCHGAKFTTRCIDGFVYCWRVK